MKVKEESEQDGLKLNIQKTKIMASGIITSWGNNGNNERVYFLSLFSYFPKSLQMVTTTMIKRFLLLGKRAMTNLDSILKNRYIALPTKVHIVKAVVFLVIMCGCESCTIKMAE